MGSMNHSNHTSLGKRHSRREFLKRSSVFAAAGVAAPLMFDLAGLAGMGLAPTAAAAAGPDYRALVCVFLYGGNDHNDTYVPYDFNSHAAYTSLRPHLSRGRNTLLPLGPDSAGERSIGFTPEWKGLKGLYDSGDVAVLANVGTLKVPVTKATFERQSNRPSQLFSHNDQQSTWQSSKPEGASEGWGGRLSDMMLESNGENSVFTSMSTGGNAVMMTGRNASQYQVDPRGVTRLISAFGNDTVLDAFREVMTHDGGGLFPQAQSAATSVALDTGARLDQALDSVGALQTGFPQSRLGKQLAMVARLIEAGKHDLSLRRQVFFVAAGGFDTHQKQVALRPNLLNDLDASLTAFHSSLVATNSVNDVTTFTASDFGRTITPNRDGSDHGWGSHHMIMGGAVNGGKVFGTLPEIVDDGPDDVGRGRLIPTTSVDQYTATLGSWMGVEQSQLKSLAPAIDRFGEADLGFMTTGKVANKDSGGSGDGGSSGVGFRAGGKYSAAKRIGSGG